MVGRTLGFAGEVEVVVERMLVGGVPGGLDGWTGSKQFISGSPLGPNGLKANEHLCSHVAVAIL